MDILILLFGLIQLNRKRYCWVLAIIVLLASSYLQLAIDNAGISSFPFVHNVYDTGLFLYVLLFGVIAIKNGIDFKNPFSKVVIYFYIFLFISGIIDVFSGVSIGDVIKYERQWLFLTIIWIIPHIPQSSIIKALKILLFVTLFMCVLLVFQWLTGVHILGDSRRYIHGFNVVERGVKPPVYVIIFIILLLSNYLGYSNQKKWLYIIILFLPIVSCLKMTYFVAVIVGYVILLFAWGKINIRNFIPYIVVGGGVLILFFSYNKVFRDRFFETIYQTKDLQSKNVSGNFSYRILHFLERADYVFTKPSTTVRGVGFIAENSIKKRLFLLGQPNDKGRIAQVDTADIAWSLLILRLGILGIVIYLCMYWKIVRFFYKNTHTGSIALVFYSYMVICLFFLSFGNAIIANSEFFILPLLFTKLNDIEL